MKFHFEFAVNKYQQPVSHRHKTVLIGSCFTENIGDKLRAHKFNVLENPHGILFNPASVSEAIIQYVDNSHISRQDIFSYNDGWHSWKHHSRFSALSPEACVQQINDSTSRAHAYLKEADHLLVTLGSAWVYTLTDKAQDALPGAVAANNHKAPADWFSKRLLSVEETLAMLDTMLHRVFLFNPHIHIIFTISPVRHLREGVIENNRSKAVLIQTVHQLVGKFNRLYYFPAYELVIDDLRDYRFYAEDLVHPNYHATQYVWEKFMDACMLPETKSLIREIAEINLAHTHKAFNPYSAQHRKFMYSYLQKTMLLKEQHPYLDLEAALQYFSSE